MKHTMIVSFLALLELVKQGIIKATKAARLAILYWRLIRFRRLPIKLRMTTETKSHNI